MHTHMHRIRGTPPPCGPPPLEHNCPLCLVADNAVLGSPRLQRIAVRRPSGKLGRTRPAQNQVAAPLERTFLPPIGAFWGSRTTKTRSMGDKVGGRRDDLGCDLQRTLQTARGEELLPGTV